MLTSQGLENRIEHPDANHGAGIFAYIYPKHGPVLWVNIPAPWSIWEPFYLIHLEMIKSEIPPG